MRVCIVALCCVVALATACRRQTDQPKPADSGSGLQTVTLPDLTPVDESVQIQIKDKYAVTQQKLADSSTADAERGLAFGELGVLLQAAEYYEAATPAYLNAQRLMPRDPRWPYYLGHLAR